MIDMTHPAAWDAEAMERVLNEAFSAVMKIWRE